MKLKKVNITLKIDENKKGENNPIQIPAKTATLFFLNLLLQ